MGKASASIATIFFGLVHVSWVTAAQANASSNLRDFIRSENDLSGAKKSAWEKAVMISFGGEALEPESSKRPEIGVAKAIISHGIFVGAKPKPSVKAAWEGYRGVMGYVPPPVAVRYQTAKLSGHKPKGTMEQMSFFFERFYDPEIATEFVSYWEKKLADGSAADYEVNEVKNTLKKTRVLMRPLLTEKLRALARLSTLQMVLKGQQLSTVKKDIAEIEGDLKRAFTKVAKSPFVVDSSKSPYRRLKRHLNDIGQELQAEDRALDPVRFKEALQKTHNAQEQKRKRKEALKALERARALEREREKAQAARIAAERERAEAEAERLKAEQEFKEARAAAKKAEAERKKAQAARQQAQRVRAEERQKAAARRQAAAERRRARAARRKAQAEEQRAQAERRRAAKEKERAAEERRAKTAMRGTIGAKERAAGLVSFPGKDIKPNLKKQYLTWKGTPYKWGGETKVRGTDCSGFTQGVSMETFAARLPRVSRLQAVHGIPIAQKDLKPGDLVFFATGRNPRKVTHVGIYLGDGRFAHASSSRGVVDDKLSKRYYQKRYLRARRFIAAY